MPLHDVKCSKCVHTEEIFYQPGYKPSNYECNKCGNGICKNKNCGWLFPHKYNSMYTICDGCYKSIENKLINYNHLIIYKFLKKNVRRRRISC